MQRRNWERSSFPPLFEGAVVTLAGVTASLFYDFCYVTRFAPPCQIIFIKKFSKLDMPTWHILFSILP